MEVPVTVDEKLWTTKRIVLNTVKYAAGDFFILDVVHGEQIPLFVKITQILSVRTNWVLVGKLYVTVEFKSHLHAYHISETDELLVFKPGEVDYHALDSYHVMGTDLITVIHRPFKPVEY